MGLRIVGFKLSSHAPSDIDNIGGDAYMQEFPQFMEQDKSQSYEKSDLENTWKLLIYHFVMILISSPGGRKTEAHISFFNK
ncbi:hypothetical protein J1N35_000428 [Gossypium stocksii]|uniref:Uncharacterized protein n=1 Tax=Gossypium stocksii TaxID=47602 RepID=A0A9D3WHM3_9ROSI|nr:hypothetical protein J1N35_000428 [Gossypium stocksii]